MALLATIDSRRPRGLVPLISWATGRLYLACGRLTTHYSAAELANLTAATEKVWRSAVLMAQNADADRDISAVLQQCVGDELDRQLENLHAIMEGGIHE